MKFLYWLRTLLQTCIGTPQQRYEARYHLTTALARKSNIRVYTKNLCWNHDVEFSQVWSRFPVGSRTIHERKFNLYYMAKALNAVPGDIAECGVYNGSSAHIMLSAMPDKHYHGFDSFDGLSEPIDIDRPQDARTFQWKKHDLKIDETFTAQCLAQHKGRFTFYKGWIPDRFTDVADKGFALVHIDVDLYQPTLDALEFFYPRLHKNGWIVCDDYGSEACPGAYKAMNDIAARHNTSVIHLTTGQGIIVKLTD